MKDLIQAIINTKFNQEEKGILQNVADRVPQKEILENIGKCNAPKIGNTQSKFYRLTENIVTWPSEGLKGEKKEAFIALVDELGLVFDESLKTDEYKNAHKEVDIVGFDTPKTPKDLKRIDEAEKQISSGVGLAPLNDVKETFFGIPDIAETEVCDKSIEKEPEPDLVDVPTLISQKVKSKEPVGICPALKDVLINIIDGEIGNSQEVLEERLSEIGKRVVTGFPVHIDELFIDETRQMYSTISVYDTLKAKITEVLG